MRKICRKDQKSNDIYGIRKPEATKARDGMDSPWFTMSLVPGIFCHTFIPSVVCRETWQKYVSWSVFFKFRILRTPDV